MLIEATIETHLVPVKRIAHIATKARFRLLQPSWRLASDFGVLLQIPHVFARVTTHHVTMFIWQ